MNVDKLIIVKVSAIVIILIIVIIVLVTIIILIILIIVVIIIRSPVSSCLRLPGTRTCLALKGFGALGFRIFRGLEFSHLEESAHSVTSLQLCSRLPNASTQTRNS